MVSLKCYLVSRIISVSYTHLVCDGNVPEEGAALEAALTRALPNAHRVLHLSVSYTHLDVYKRQM